MEKINAVFVSLALWSISAVIRTVDWLRRTWIGIVGERCDYCNATKVYVHHARCWHCQRQWEMQQKREGK